MTRRSWPLSGLLATGAVALIVSGLVIAVVMMSSGSNSGSSVRLSNNDANSGTKSMAKTKAAAQSAIVCPDVAGRLPAIPASAQAEVTRNLTLLQTQITEADTRLADTVGQGGPNFVQNAILGPLKDKRIATIDRIATAIGRTAAKPTGLDSLATCTLRGGAAAKPSRPAAAKPKPARTAAPTAGRSGTKITCPDVAGRLPAIPASAQAEVTRNLALLQTQITEANTRLANTVGQGGPNFVQNAILGPLKDKRIATIDRIAIAIGRTAAKPTGLDSLATCSLTG